MLWGPDPWLPCSWDWRSGRRRHKVLPGTRRRRAQCCTLLQAAGTKIVSVSHPRAGSLGKKGLRETRPTAGFQHGRNLSSTFSTPSRDTILPVAIPLPLSDRRASSTDKTAIYFLAHRVIEWVECDTF